MSANRYSCCFQLACVIICVIDCPDAQAPLCTGDSYLQIPVSNTNITLRLFLCLLPQTRSIASHGVAEAANADEVLFGTDRLLEALNRAPDAAPEAAIENVNEALRGFVGDAEQSDDITMLCLRYCGAGEKPSFPE